MYMYTHSRPNLSTDISVEITQHLNHSHQSLGW